MGDKTVPFHVGSEARCGVGWFTSGWVPFSSGRGTLYLFIFNLFIFQLRDNCFTEFCCFLSNINMNQPSVQFSSIQSLSRVRLFATPWNRSTPGLPVHHHLPEFTQTHVYRVHDAIQPSHPGSSPSPPAPNLSQHQSLFQ